jgi:ribosome biogenesis GTPase
MTRGVVVRGTGGVWTVLTDQGRELDASLRGRLKLALPLKLAVGDEVEVEHARRGDAWAIANVLPRRSQLARRAPGGAHGERVVAANVDQVVVMFAAAQPEPHPRMLDRFLVIAEANRLAARIVINKVDLVGDDVAVARFGHYARSGYAVHYTSVRLNLGLAQVHDALQGRTSVLTGPSGVGKSSLMNRLYPGLDLRVADISASVNKGRHTTVGAFLHPLPGGGSVVDTPGLREVGMWDLPPTHLDACFPEFRPFLGACRYADCAHVSEPACAIRDAVARGEIHTARYESYVKLRDELEAAPRTW